MTRKPRRWALRIQNSVLRLVGSLPEPLQARELELYCHWVLRQPEGHRAATLRGDRAAHPDVARSLVRRSRELFSRDPERCLYVAQAAVDVAESLSLPPEAQALESDLRAEAWANLANALRITGRLEAAAGAWLECDRRLETGTGDALLEAHVARMKGSYFTTIRSFPNAFKLYERATLAAAGAGEEHLAARARVDHAEALNRAGRPEEALELNTLALQGLDHHREPEISFALLHNTLVCFEAAGLEQLALQGLEAAERHYRLLASPIVRVRYHWMRGRLYNTLGVWPAAVADLEAARAGFLERGLSYDAAFVGIELALAHASLQQWSRVRHLAAELLPLFERHHLPQEAMAVLLTFREATLAARATLADLEAWARDLRPLRSAYERGEPWAEAVQAA